MLGIFYALITVAAWGTWLAPSQTISYRNQQIKTFYVAAANLVLALFISLTQDLSALTPAQFGPPFLGGLIWSVSGLCAFTATQKIGIAKAFGIWAPFNILVSVVWGAVLFGEFLNLSAGNLVLLVFSLVLILAGVLMMILTQDSESSAPRSRRDTVIGVLCALAAGVLWGSYYLPINQSPVSMWVLSLPLAVGIFTGSAILLALTRANPRLGKLSDYARTGASGLLWGIGNYGMLLLVSELGAGRGFTISQLSVVLNALIGVFWLRTPAPRTRAAALTLTGCVIATVGGIILGSLK